MVESILDAHEILFRSRPDKLLDHNIHVKMVDIMQGFELNIMINV